MTDGGVHEEVGGGNLRRGASRAGNSATVASPGPAPKTIIALSSGWLAIRPRWIVHRCYSGPWRPRRGRRHRDLDRPRELFVMLRQPGRLRRRAFAAHCRCCAGVIKKRSGGSSIIGIYPSLSVHRHAARLGRCIDAATWGHSAHPSLLRMRVGAARPVLDILGAAGRTPVAK
jgi:hypothetical protein